MTLHSKIGYFQVFVSKYGVDKSLCPHMFQRPYYCGMISTIYHFEFPAQLSANNIRLFSKLTNRVTG